LYIGGTVSESNSALLVEKNGAIVTLTWNRPESLNAINQASAESFLEALSTIETDRSIRCVVLRGAGKAFMAGGDIGVMYRDLPDSRTAIKKLIEPLHKGLLVMERMPQPVVVSVHGHAAGAGASIAFAADLGIAAESAVFGLSYSKIGATPDGSGTFSLPRLVGLRRAMEIALLADPIPAPRAFELGLINRVVPDDMLEAETYALAERIAQGPAEAYASTKRLLRESLGRSLEEQLKAEEETFLSTALTPDFAEGVSAFVEKRRPRYGQK